MAEHRRARPLLGTVHGVACRRVLFASLITFFAACCSCIARAYNVLKGCKIPVTSHFFERRTTSWVSCGVAVVRGI